MASLVDQILSQSQAASANGQGFGEFYMKGRDQAQRQETINLKKQQLAMQLAQLPLKQTLMQQDAQMNSLKLTDMLEQRQLLIQNEGALQEAYNLAGQALASGNPEDAEGYVMDTISRTLGATRDKRFQQLLEDVRMSASAKMQLQELRNSVSGERLRIQQERLDLERQRHQRLQEQFDFQRTRFERTVPQDKLALFRERAALIRNDIELIGNAPLAESKLKALAEELGISQPVAPPLGTSPARATNAPAFKVKVIKP
jgi:hypothetical protein